MNTTLKTAPETPKALRHIHRSSDTHWVGNGFPVRSVFDYNGLGRELSPFLLLDYAAPHVFPPSHERRGVGAHPHRGFETVTITYHGELEHRDSSGGGGKIGPGDVQWMTAAGGIVHEEFHSAEFNRQGGTLEMVQLWVNLPARFKGEKPGYQTLFKADIPEIQLPNKAGLLRLIAGEFDGRRGPARTFTPILLGDLQLRAGKPVQLPVPTGFTAALLVRNGEIQAGEGPQATAGDLAVFERTGNRIELKAETDAGLLLLAGEPIVEPIVGHGPFVMNSRAEIQQAFEDYQLGRMGGLKD
jgi:redox-sensitive bicupin YhaK (pirin superfamily)